MLNMVCFQRNLFVFDFWCRMGFGASLNGGDGGGSC